VAEQEQDRVTASGWRESVVDYIRAQALPVDKFGHQPRLYALAMQVGQGTDYDDDILFAAAWMHDLGVFIGHRPQDSAELASWNHVPYTIARTRELLAGWGFPAEKLEGVAEAIRTHQPDDEPVRIEAVLLRDADILEQLGAVGAMRALVKVGRETRYATSRDLAEPRVELLRLLIAAIEEEAGGLLF
jgi:uncharacterized protein